MLLTFYADESANNRTFNFGGWLAVDSAWRRIESQWERRIEHDRQKHGKLARYHASDCSSLVGDYKGWSKDDQIGHAKKLMGIVTRRRSDMVAMSFGVDLAALTRVFPNPSDPLAPAYNLCIRKLMGMIYRAVKRNQGHRVAIIHDHTPNHDGVILAAFNSMLDDPKVPHYKELFTTIAPMRWQDCTALQPADMIAYDTFKLLDADIYSTPRMRRSLQELVGSGVRVAAHYWGENNLVELKRRHQASLNGGPVTVPIT